MLLTNNKVRVLCFANETMVKGLQWAFDQKVFSERSYEFFPASLARLPENLGDFNLFLLALDLGQPVPLENLRKLPAVPGVCALLQPTPQQLLTISELPDWNALAWDGVSFERIAVRLDVLSARSELAAKSRDFIETSRLWLVHHLENPAAFEWVNPPESWAGPKTFKLDVSRRLISVGALNGKSDVKLPVPGTQEFCEFRYGEGAWGVRIANGVEGAMIGNQDAMRPGDQIEVNGLFLKVKMAQEVEDFLGIARKSGLFGDLPLNRKVADDLTLADVCREFLSAWTTGELRVSSGLRNGSIYFVDGMIRHAVTGAVSGVKALLRMLGWPDPAWRFNAGVESELNFPDLDLGFAEFTDFHRRWKDEWAKFKTFVPPSHLRLKASAKNFNKKMLWTVQDYRVLSAVCEYELVRDIFNHCLLSDVEILSSLVEMRRHGLIEPVVPAPASV